MIRPLSVAATLLLAVVWGAQAAPQAARQQELLELLRHDCGSCHGLTLQGGLGPALLPQALRDKPPEFLAATILYGRPGTPMPPWLPFLDEDEALWLAHRIKEGLE